LNSHIDRTVRIRTVGEKGIITVKGRTFGATRSEFEYEIPYNDAKEMLQLCEQPLIQKTRYLIEGNGLVWEIDEFEGVNKGLIVAEIELAYEQQEFLMPKWVGKEVTQDARYYNSSLILNPFSSWNH
jgi:CYTH domain-containing protein